MITAVFKKAGFAIVSIAAVGLSGCASTTSDFVPMGGEVFAAKAMDHPIDVFQDGASPDRAYTEIAEVFTSMEATHMVKRSSKEGLETLKEMAREAGGDGIINITEKGARHLETRQVIISGTAIRYKN